jgi:hypothetical protein
VAEALEQWLSQQRTWSSRQLSEALHARGIVLGPRPVRRHLKRIQAGSRRTVSSLTHKQDPAKAVLDNLKEKARASRLRLYYLDACGFAPALPIRSSWCLPRQCKRVPYEYPQGRRVNDWAGSEPWGSELWLEARAFERTLTSEDLLVSLGQLPTAAVPRSVVWDNASLHISKVVKARRRTLAQSGISLYYLPADSPQLNEIEPLFKQVKHHEIPKRSHQAQEELRASVEQGFASYGAALRRKSYKQLRPAA